VPTNYPGLHVGQIQVANWDAQSAAAWNDFVSAAAGGTFYHLHEWSKINRECLGHDSSMLSATSNGELQGVLPLTRVRSALFGDILCSMPFVNYGGPCCSTPEALSALLSAAQSLADDMGVRHLELRCADVVATNMTLSTRKVSMSIALAPDPETLWNAFSSKHRTNIRRSYKNELVVSPGGLELLQTFYDVMQVSWRDLGTPL
jgi:hypothetical protein